MSEGCPIEKSLIRIGFLGLLLIYVSAKRIELPLYILAYVFSVIEALAWHVNHSPINFQIILAIDFKYAWSSYRSMYIYVIFIIMALILFITPFWKMRVIMSNVVKSTLSMLIIIFGYSFYRDLKTGFIPIQSPFIIASPKTLEYLQSGKISVQTPHTKMPNIILVEIESLEVQCVTQKYMPLLYNLSQEHLYLDDIISQPYTTYTTGAMMAIFCNIPHIVSKMKAKIRSKDKIDKYRTLKCFPDFLKKIGYENHVYNVNSLDVMGMGDFLEGHNFTLHMNLFKKDTQLFKYVSESILPKLVNNKNPMMTYILNDETHFPYRVSKNKCNPEIDPDESRVRKLHNCFDQNLRILVNKFKELGLEKNTELIIYGDHLVPSTKRYIKWEEDVNKRRLFILFASRPPQKIIKPITYYDIAPTIMSMVGAKKYYPRFPFGADIFSENIGTPPTNDELTFLFNYFADTLKLNVSREFHCLGKKSSTKACIDTNYV